MMRVDEHKRWPTSANRGGILLRSTASGALNSRGLEDPMLVLLLQVQVLEKAGMYCVESVQS